MNGVAFKVEGLAELHRALSSVAKNVAGKQIRNAVTAAAVVVRDAAKARAPVYTGAVADGHPPPGTLRRAIAIRRGKRDSTASRVAYQVFVRSWARTGKTKRQRAQGVKAYGRFDAYYWHMVEFGTRKMSARPFMRAGFEASKSAALERLTARLREGVAAAAAEAKGGR